MMERCNTVSGILFAPSALCVSCLPSIHLLLRHVLIIERMKIKLRLWLLAETALWRSQTSWCLIQELSAASRHDTLFPFAVSSDLHKYLDSAILLISYCNAITLLSHRHCFPTVFRDTASFLLHKLAQFNQLAPFNQFFSFGREGSPFRRLNG